MQDYPQCPTLARRPPSRQACLSSGPELAGLSWDRWEDDSLQILALHPVSHLIKVVRGRRGQGVFDLKVEVERLCEEEEAEPTHWDEGLWVVVVKNQDLNK